MQPVAADPLDGLGEAARRDPDADPAVAEAAGAFERRVGAAADEDRDRRIGRGADGRIADAEVATREVDRVAGQEGAHERQRFGGSPSARAGVDAAQLELARIVAADADPEREAAGGEHGDRGERPRDRCGVADAQQVDAGLDRERGVGGEQRHRLDEAVGTVAAAEADVVTDGQVIDPRRGRRARELSEPAAIDEQVGFPEDEADADPFRGHIHEVRSI